MDAARLAEIRERFWSLHDLSDISFESYRMVTDLLDAYEALAAENARLREAEQRVAERIIQEVAKYLDDEYGPMQREGEA